MKLKEFLKGLGITPWATIKSYIFGDGLWGIAKLLCKAFSKVLKKVLPENLVKYADTVHKIASCVSYAVATFVTDAAVKEACDSLVFAIDTFADHLADGEYTCDELQNDVANISNMIDLLKVAVGREKGKKE